jgi:hypothetical protein
MLVRGQRNDIHTKNQLARCSQSPQRTKNCAQMVAIEIAEGDYSAIAIVEAKGPCGDERVS